MVAITDKGGRIVVASEKGIEAESRLLRIGEAAQLLHVHPNTLRKWSDEGQLEVYRIGPRRDRRFNREEILHFLSNNGKFWKT